MSAIGAQAAADRRALLRNGFVSQKLDCSRFRLPASPVLKSRRGKTKYRVSEHRSTRSGSRCVDCKYRERYGVANSLPHSANLSQARAVFGRPATARGSKPRVRAIPPRLPARRVRWRSDRLGVNELFRTCSTDRASVKYEPKSVVMPHRRRVANFCFGSHYVL